MDDSICLRLSRAAGWLTCSPAKEETSIMPFPKQESPDTIRRNLVPLSNEELVAIVGVDNIDLDGGCVANAVALVVLQEVDSLRAV